jgi:hypothetical protein
MGISSLDSRNPMVVILEREFENVRKLLVEYTKLHVQAMILINVCNVIFCVSIMANIPLLIVSEICINVFMRNMLKKIHGECNLKQVGKIVFNQEYDISNVRLEDVYNSTRELSCMKGKLYNVIYIIRTIERFCITATIITVAWSILLIILYNLFLK